MSRLRRLKKMLRLPNLRWAAAMVDVVDPENRRFLDCAEAGHFYSPLPNMRDVWARSAAIFDRSKSDLPGIDLKEPGQMALAKALSKWQADIPFPARPEVGSRYHLHNNFFATGDATVLYGMMREFRPRRIVEVGSGFSSAAMLDVNDRFFAGRIELTFVEPEPSRLNALLVVGDLEHVRIIRRQIQDVPLSEFDALEANDILFIDSSHVAKIGSDVLYLILEVLPRLRPGVLVHVHDVFWPFEYPLKWVELGRAWNEAYFVRAFLQNNSRFDILYFNDFMALHHRNEVMEYMPRCLDEPSSESAPGNSSLWLQCVK